MESKGTRQFNQVVSRTTAFRRTPLVVIDRAARCRPVGNLSGHEWLDRPRWF